MEFITTLKKIFSDFASSNAFCINDTHYTYAQLAGRVKTISALLHTVSNGGISKVGVVTNNSIDTYASILACWTMGYVYVPLNCNYPKERNDFIITELRLT